MNVISIDVRSEEEDAALIMQALIDAGKTTRFVDALVERRDLWTCICWLEDDLLAFTRHNRWCLDLSDWTIILGHFPYSENVPKYTGYGDLTAWIDYRGQAVTISSLRQGEDDDDLIVWDDKFVGVPYAWARMAEDSGIHLNRMMRDLRTAEAIWEL